MQLINFTSGLEVEFGRADYYKWLQWYVFGVAQQQC